MHYLDIVKYVYSDIINNVKRTRQNKKRGSDMYTFELHYIDIDTGRDIIKTLKVDSQLYETEKEIFIHAMNRAYDMMNENELFYRLDYKGSY